MSYKTLAVENLGKLLPNNILVEKSIIGLVCLHSRSVKIFVGG